MKLDQEGFERELVARVGAVGEIEKLFCHFDLLRRWNARLNLTAIRDEVEMVERHFCESIFLARHVPRETRTVFDIGSGGGFPGIPLAVLRPEIRVTLIESHQRKAVFLKEATRALPNVEILAKRAEEIDRQADLLVSRAVAHDSVLRLTPRIAARALLLAGDLPLGTLQRVQLPWGERRFLVQVECS